MNWQDKLENHSNLTFFFSGVVVAIMVSFLFYEPNNELEAQPAPPIMPGALGDSMLPQIEAVKSTTAKEVEPPSSTLMTPSPLSETNEEPPMPGTVDNPPIPKAVEQAPLPDPVENLPIPETVAEPSAFFEPSNKNPAMP